MFEIIVPPLTPEVHLKDIPYINLLERAVLVYLNLQ